ncbi:MAG: hypothetical protein K2Q03_02725, partial [Sphingobacteriaceae bacterium]|nr:hypothetical protein [Sphingobacteriaceae bacterium]
MENKVFLNLFTSEFIVGMALPAGFNFWEFKNSKEEPLNDTLKTLKIWIDYKENDWAMKSCRLAKTQYIAYLHLIDLDSFKIIINDLALIYKKEYPYSETSNFIECIFGNTLCDLKQFIQNKYLCYGAQLGINNRIYFTKDGREFIDFILEPNLDIEYYKQYYKRVIEVIENFEYSNTAPTRKIIKIETIKHDLDNLREQGTPLKLSDLITDKNSIEIVESIKIQYKNIKGKRLKLLLLALQGL